MADNFGQKFLALQLAMILFGVLLFLGLYMLQKTLRDDGKMVQAVSEQTADTNTTEEPAASVSPVQ